MKVNLLKKFESFEGRDIIDAFETALKEEPNKILYDKDKGYLVYQVEAPDVKSPEQFLYERIMELDILEIASKNVLQTLLKIFYNLTSENLFIGSIVCGESLQLFSTLDTSFSAPKKLLFGYPVVEIKEFEPSTVLLLITDKKNPELPDYKSVIKLSLGEP